MGFSIGLGLVLLGFTAADLAKDMAALDRAYVPALAITNQDNVPMAQKALEVLLQRWESFKTKYAQMSGQDPEWQADTAYIEGQIQQAGAIVKTGKNIPQAHEALEGVRLRMLAARQRMKIDYYLDHLTVFHEHMEEIFTPAKNKTPATLTEEDVTRIARALPEAKAAWLKVESANFDNNLYKLSEQKLAERGKYLKAIPESLKNVESALQQKEKAELMKAATALRGNFSRLFILFGDYDSLK